MDKIKETIELLSKIENNMKAEEEANNYDICDDKNEKNAIDININNKKIKGNKLLPYKKLLNADNRLFIVKAINSKIDILFDHIQNLIDNNSDLIKKYIVLTSLINDYLHDVYYYENILYGIKNKDGRVSKPVSEELYYVMNNDRYNEFVNGIELQKDRCMAYARCNDISEFSTIENDLIQDSDLLKEKNLLDITSKYIENIKNKQEMIYKIFSRLIIYDKNKKKEKKYGCFISNFILNYFFNHWVFRRKN